MDDKRSEYDFTSAWGKHRAGDHSGAQQGFQQALAQNPNDMDAYFGLGLAQRSARNSEAALQSFEKARELARKALEENPGADRFEMILKMIGQRISEIQNKTLVS